MCRICKYNQVKDIDRALLAGVTPNSLSQKYSFSVTELERHQDHLAQKMAQAGQRFHDHLHQVLFLKLNLVMEMLFGVVRGAKTGGDMKLFLQSSREFTRVITLMHKMQVRLDPEFIYCLMATPQWDLQEESLLPNAFQALSKTRQSLKVNLYAPCPEPDPASAPDHRPSPTLATPNSPLGDSVHPRPGAGITSALSPGVSPPPPRGAMGAT